jgi:hypothetical protein
MVIGGRVVMIQSLMVIGPHNPSCQLSKLPETAIRLSVLMQRLFKNTQTVHIAVRTGDHSPDAKARGRPIDVHPE